MNKRLNELRCLCAHSVENNLLCFALLIFNSASNAQVTWVSVVIIQSKMMLSPGVNECVCSFNGWFITSKFNTSAINHIKPCCALPHFTVSLEEFGLVGTVLYSLFSSAGTSIIYSGFCKIQPVFIEITWREKNPNFSDMLDGYMSLSWC